MATNSIRVKIIKRKDGFYWMVNGLSPEGPFTTKEEAEADARDYFGPYEIVIVKNNSR